MDDSANQRDRIEAAAQAILQESGASALTVRHIAERAGVSTMGVYNYFGSKDQVCERLYIAGFEDLGRQVSEVGPSENREAAIFNSARIYLDFYRRNKHRYALMFGMGAADYEPGDSARRAARKSFAQLAAVVGGLPEGAVPGREDWQLALKIWASTHGFIAIKSHMTGISESDWEALVLESVRQLITARPVQ